MLVAHLLTLALGTRQRTPERMLRGASSFVYRQLVVLPAHLLCASFLGVLKESSEEGQGALKV